MRKLFSLFVALLATTSLWAYDFKSGDLYYKITSETTVKVTSEQYASFDNYSSLTTAIIPETITHNGTTYSVTSIGDFAFWYCSSLTSVTIPNSVTYIGEQAFRGCSSLTSVTIGNSVTNIGHSAFSNCSFLTTITIDNSVTSIGDYAFSSCSSLTSVTIGNSVTSIGGYTFYDCSSLTSITIPNSVTSIGNSAFYNCSSLTSVTIPNSVTSIGDRAFSSCSSLTSVTIGNSVTSIGDYAFWYCSSLTSLTIPNSVTSIGEWAFSWCFSLTSITIPNSVTSIGNSAFSSCYSLTSITIPNSVTSIGDKAFHSCSSLTSITCLGTTPPTLGTDVFYGTKLSAVFYIPDNTLSAYQTAWGNEYVFVNNETTLTLHVATPGTLADLIFDAGTRPALVAKLTLTGTLNDDDFTCMRQTMTSLVDVDLSRITNTSGVNFNGKARLVRIILPANLTSIGDYAFSSCSSLTSVTIGNSVTSIGSWAFANCYSLSTITCEATTPPTLGSDVFYGVSTSIPVYVPCGSENIYKAASGWKDFTNIQEPLAEYSIQVSTSNSQMGSAIVVYNTSCGAQISATANYGYHFVCWSDGNTDNPCTIVLTQDTTLTAEFAQTLSGTCGDNLTWQFQPEERKLIIEGEGNMYDYQFGGYGWWGNEDKGEVPWSHLSSDIKTILLPEGMTSIGDGAFSWCIAIKTISIPNSVKTIGYAAFTSCDSLTFINFGTNITHIGPVAFAGCSAITILNIPNSVTSIGADAFLYCSSLTSVAIPNSVTSIGGGAFSGCSSLTSVTIPNSVTSIGNSAFGGCSSLTSVTIGNSVTSIGNYAFSRCSSLTSITCLGVTPPEASDLAANTSTCKLIVPHSAYNAYLRHTYWGKFLNIVPSSEMESSAPDIYINPANPAQKLLRNGQVYILKDDKVYTIMGAEIQ